MFYREDDWRAIRKSQLEIDATTRQTLEETIYVVTHGYAVSSSVPARGAVVLCSYQRPNISPYKCVSGVEKKSL
jgi:hypothetical protein